MKRQRPETPRVIIGDNIGGPVTRSGEVHNLKHFLKIFPIL